MSSFAKSYSLYAGITKLVSSGIHIMTYLQVLIFLPYIFVWPLGLSPQGGYPHFWLCAWPGFQGLFPT